MSEENPFIKRMHEAYRLLENHYNISCNNCNKPINAVEFSQGSHFCSRSSKGEADLLVTCKKCGEIIWDSYNYSEIGKHHLNNNHNCKEDEISNN